MKVEIIKKKAIYIAGGEERSYWKYYLVLENGSRIRINPYSRTKEDGNRDYSQANLLFALAEEVQ